MRKRKKVFNGWLGLTAEERREFETAIRDYNNAADSRRVDIRESVRKSATRMETGPLGSGCPCCGR